MNFALPTLLLFFLFIAPGIFFRRFYYTLDFSKQFRIENTFNVFVSSIFVGAMVHMVFFVIVNLFTPWVLNAVANEFTSIRSVCSVLILKIDFALVIDFIYPPKNDTQASYKELIEHPNFREGLIIIYFILLYGFSALTGKLSLWFVRKRKWDIKYKILRFKNYWYYLFSGETLEFPEVKSRTQSIEINIPGKIRSRNGLKHFEVETTYIDTVVKVGEEPTIYKGIFLDYYLNAQGDELESLCIGESQRRLLHCKNPTPYTQQTNSWHKFESDVFIVPAKQILNLNISFIALPAYDIAISIINTFYRAYKEDPKKKDWNIEYFPNKFNKGGQYLNDLGALEAFKKCRFRRKHRKVMIQINPDVLIALKAAFDSKRKNAK